MQLINLLRTLSSLQTQPRYGSLQPSTLLSGLDAGSYRQAKNSSGGVEPLSIGGKMDLDTLT